MSEFCGGSSEVSESTEVNETPPEETGGESSEATQETATEEANESGGFDDAEDTEAPDSNEDTEDIDSGWIISLCIGLFIVMCVVAIIVYGGAFIGGWHSLKNYVLAFKHNVFDSNRAPVSVA